MSLRTVIVGGGIAGLSTALALERRGIIPTVLERAHGPRGAGYMLDFFGPGYHAAERLGLLDAVAEIHYPIDRIVFTDGDGAPQVTIPYPVMRRRVFGGRHYNFLRGDLESLLVEHLEATDVRYGVAPVSISTTDRDATVSLDDGTRLVADVVIGADGIHSFTREALFGPERDVLRPLGHVVAAYVIDERIATGHGDAFVTASVPGRMVAVYPIRGGRTATFFVHRADRIEAPPGAMLRARFGDLGWIVPSVLDRMPGDEAIYVDTTDQIVMPRWHGGRVALVGDAAWCPTLLAGQGASLAVAGGEALADELSAGDDVAAALARYEARLRPVVETRQRAGRRTADWFVPESRVRLFLRQVALRATTWPVVSAIVARSMGTRAAS